VGKVKRVASKHQKILTNLRTSLPLGLFNTFQFAHAYANGEGMKHYVNMVQEPEFAARDQGYTFVSHQQEVGAGYFDDVTTVIQGGSSSVKALTGSTEEEQFH
jgi:isocitrate lyase